MKRYFMEGGPLFMGILTFILLIILVMTVYYAVIILKKDEKPDGKFLSRLGYIKNTGLFAMVFGVFGQLLGLYQAFSVIQKVGDISPAILAGGLKISMLSTLYGIIIYMISWLLWIILNVIYNKVYGKNS